MLATYRLNLTPDDNGTFLVTAPAFPELTTFGEDVARAATRGRDALLEAIAARVASQAEVPLDTAKNDYDGQVLSVELPALVSLKLDLYRDMEARGAGR